MHEKPIEKIWRAVGALFFFTIKKVCFLSSGWPGKVWRFASKTAVVVKTCYSEVMISGLLLPSGGDNSPMRKRDDCHESHGL